MRDRPTRGGGGQTPDPEMKVAVVALLPSVEASLLAGRLEADGIRTMVSMGESERVVWAKQLAPQPGPLTDGPWAGDTQVLVEERDLERARRIAAGYLRRS